MVYGAVALIVKADDVGLHMASSGRLSATRAAGEAIVRGMPGFLRALTIIGTAAMLWVGGSIIVHGLGELGWHAPEDWIDGVAHAVGGEQGLVPWLVKAGIDGVLGVALGLALIPIATGIVNPILRAVGLASAEAH